MKDLCALNRVQSSTRNVASYHTSVDVCFVRVWRVYVCGTGSRVCVALACGRMSVTSREKLYNYMLLHVY